MNADPDEAVKVLNLRLDEPLYRQLTAEAKALGQEPQR
jgi:hypothetical protein